MIFKAFSPPPFTHFLVGAPCTTLHLSKGFASVLAFVEFHYKC